MSPNFIAGRLNHY